MSQFTKRMLPLLVLFLIAGVHQARAQQQVSMYFGMGSATNGQASDPTCTLPHELFDVITGVCEPSPSMGGVFGVIGGDVLIGSLLGSTLKIRSVLLRRHICRRRRSTCGPRFMTLTHSTNLPPLTAT